MRPLLRLPRAFTPGARGCKGGDVDAILANRPARPQARPMAKGTHDTAPDARNAGILISVFIYRRVLRGQELTV
mgnify:CR=1 FL=1